ncbi:MAG: glycosyltransferase [Verrucomicrobiales bacterium]|nr:glycosyltransferase [Verrucomicrobiales bacterium]
MPRVTVIVPNYNHARFLPQRLDSVFGQTFQDFEVLLLDDASTDDSRDVLLRYARDPRARTLFNERNSGTVFRQWNRGLREAKGDFVWIAESDDFADSRLLECLVAGLSEHPGAGVAVCESQWVDERGVAIPRSERPIVTAGAKPGGAMIPGHRFVTHSMLLGCSIQNASAVVFRRATAAEIGYADETFRLAGDWMFWVRMLERSDCLAIAEPLNHWRQHGATVRAKVRGAGYGSRDALRVGRYILAHFETAPDQRRSLRETLVFKVWRDIFCRNRQIGPGQRLKVLGDALRFDPRIGLGLFRFGVQRVFGRWAPESP